MQEAAIDLEIEKTDIYSGPPSVYPLIQKEELLEEMMVKIQERTTEIFEAM